MPHYRTGRGWRTCVCLVRLWCAFSSSFTCAPTSPDHTPLLLPTLLVGASNSGGVAEAAPLEPESFDADKDEDEEVFTLTVTAFAKLKPFLGGAGPGGISSFGMSTREPLDPDSDNDAGAMAAAFLPLSPACSASAAAAMTAPSADPNPVMSSSASSSEEGTLGAPSPSSGPGSAVGSTGSLLS